VPNSFDQIAALQPDVQIVDVVIGQQAGWELLERLHADAATSGIPVLVTSTSEHLLQTALEQAARYGTHRYLSKPFHLDTVVAQIREMIGEARAGGRSHSCNRPSTLPSCAHRKVLPWPPPPRLIATLLPSINFGTTSNPR
jgi:response regulator RpfG family c-di-GMP phosphodiesterase